MRWSNRAPIETQPWLKWFAWFPVQVEFRSEYAWLEVVERKKFYPYESNKKTWFYEYRYFNKKS